MTNSERAQITAIVDAAWQADQARQAWLAAVIARNVKG